MDAAPQAPASGSTARPASSGARPGALGRVLALALAPLAVYALGGLDGPFVFDDREAIVENRSLDGGSLAELLWPPADTSASGRPLVNLSLALSKAVSGLDPAGFRAFNLALHVLATLVLYALLARTLRSPALSARTAQAAQGLAFAAALLWAVHPLLSETVLYAIQRTELLLGLFYLAALYALARAAAAPVASRGAAGWSALAIAAALLGALSKESIASLPLVALLYDRTFFAGSLREALRRRAGLYAGLAASWLVVLWVMLAAPRGRSVGFAAPGRGDALDYALTQCALLVRYLKLLVWPAPLVFDYGPLVPASVADVWPQALALLALLAATLVWLRRRPALGFAPAAFFLVLAPTSSIVPIVTEVGAERRMYLPAAALIAAAVVLAHGLLARRAPVRPALAIGLVALAAAALSFLTVARAREYASLVSIWTTVAERRPANARGHYNLGIALGEAGRPLEAIDDYRAAIALREGYGEAHENLANTLAHLGRLDEALVHARRAVELLPGEARPLANLALTQLAAGRPEEALAAALRALELDPSRADAHHACGLAFKALGRLTEAENELRAAVRRAPDDPFPRYNLARLLADKAAPDALEHALRAAELAPGDPDAHLLAAGRLLVAGRAQESLAHYRAGFAALAAAGRADEIAAACDAAAEAAERAGRPEVAAELRALRP